MKKSVLVAAFLTIGVMLSAQDLTEISSNLLGKQVYEIKSTLDEMNVWHYQHLPNKIAKRTFVLTIEDGNGVSFMIKILINEETKKIERITVNFAHNNSTQIKVLRKLINYDAFHVGINSTDIYYNLNGKATQPTGLNRVIDE